MDRNICGLALIAIPLLSISPAAFGHEYWIEPATYHPKANSVVTITSHIGERFAGAPVIFDGERCVKFETVGPAAATPILGRSGGPLAYARVAAEGNYILGFRSTRTLHEMQAAPFENYLKEEGLGFIVEQRRKLGESDKPGREYFSRCSKSIVTVGPACDGFDRVIGQTLEIVAETNPGKATAEGTFKVRVLFEGRGLSGATVVAVARDKPADLMKAMTDADGRAELTLSKAGVYMITTIHMVRVKDDPKADWESLWASVTFDFAGGRSVADAPAAAPAKQTTPPPATPQPRANGGDGKAAVAPR